MKPYYCYTLETGPHHWNAQRWSSELQLGQDIFSRLHKGAAFGGLLQLLFEHSEDLKDPKILVSLIEWHEWNDPEQAFTYLRSIGDLIELVVKHHRNSLGAMEEVADCVDLVLPRDTHPGLLLRAYAMGPAHFKRAVAHHLGDGAAVKAHLNDRLVNSEDEEWDVWREIGKLIRRPKWRNENDE